MNRVFGLDLMRFLAIAFVVLGHGWHFLPPTQLILFMNNVWVFGVEIFFVLSGFLIGGILIRVLETDISIQAIKEFWIRRWFRTLPNYYLFLLINFVGFSLFRDNYEWNISYLFFGQNLAWMPDRFFSVSWSLAVEEWFYLSLPLLIVSGIFLFGRVSTAIVTAALSVISLVIAARLYGSFAHGYRWNEELRLIVALRLDSLMYGVLMASLVHFRHDIFDRKAKMFGSCGALAIIASILLISSGTIDTSPTAAALTFPIACIGFASMIPLLVNCAKPRLTWLHVTITSISIWSYSLYLLHVPVFEFAKLFIAPYVNLYKAPYNIMFLIIWIATSIWISFLVYKYWELPSTSLRNRWTQKVDVV